jgi:hypothetical protein
MLIVRLVELPKFITKNSHGIQRFVVFLEGEVTSGFDHPNYVKYFKKVGTACE